MGCRRTGENTRRRDHQAAGAIKGQVIPGSANKRSLDCRSACAQILRRTRDASGRRNRVRFAALAHDEEKHMSRLSLFNSPLLLGFDHFERALDRVSKVSADGYPPYNVEQLGENALRITLAVAGFQMSELSITIEDNQLVVRGK